MSQQANDNSESRFMGLMTRIADKTGALGSVVSAMGCAACFPALASFGAAIGLGFLSQYEGLFISRLLPLFPHFAMRKVSAANEIYPVFRDLFKKDGVSI